MGIDASGRRRWFGAVILTLAMLMLIAGETILKGRLAGLSFLLYWLACFVLTGTAMLAAILDLRAVQRRTRDEQRVLLENALIEIQTKNRAKRRPPRQSS
jgi:hypothetical protein